MARWDRRNFLKTGAMGALTFKLGGCDVQMSPREAREKGVSFETLSADEARVLARFCDVLLPGAAQEGAVHFIDNQISGDPADCLSILRYMDWPPPYADFYKAGAAALDALSRARFDAAFADLDEDSAKAMTTEISAGQPEGWSGPPAPLFYFVLRSDAVDVVYGTMAGFEKLSVPYLAHIEPESKW